MTEAISVEVLKQHKHTLEDNKCIDCGQRFLYNNGLPFTAGRGEEGDLLAENLFDLKQRITKKKASLIIIDGGVGEGKTTFATEVAEQHQGSQLNFEKQLAYGGEEFQEKIKICIEEGLSVIIYDEAGDFSKRGSLTAFNKMLNRVFETYRTFKILVIMCMPNFGVLDQTLFDNKIPRLLLNCHNREERYGNFRAYSLYRMFWLRKYMKDIVVTPQAYSIVDPNFRGHFLDLFPDRSAELDEWSTEAKKGILDEQLEVSKTLLDYQQLADKLDRSTRWVKSKVKELNIQPARIIKQKYFFDKSVYEQISEEGDE